MNRDILLIKFTSTGIGEDGCWGDVEVSLSRFGLEVRLSKRPDELDECLRSIVLLDLVLSSGPLATNISQIKYIQNAVCLSAMFGRFGKYVTF
jgi:hypothetical protein